jgi:transposase
MERKKYSREFKLEAVNLVKARGVSIVQAARDLELNHNVLRRWLKELDSDPQNAFPGLGQMKPEQLEIDRLRKEVVRLKAERDILKKAAVGSTGQRNMIYFMKQPEAHNGKDRTTRFIATTER